MYLQSPLWLEVDIFIVLHRNVSNDVAQGHGMNRQYLTLLFSWGKKSREKEFSWDVSYISPRAWAPLAPSFAFSCSDHTRRAHSDRKPHSTGWFNTPSISWPRSAQEPCERKAPNFCFYRFDFRSAGCRVSIANVLMGSAAWIRCTSLIHSLQANSPIPWRRTDVMQY